jgi:membrane protein implicated in regulation of membrane protease activity
MLDPALYWLIIGVMLFVLELVLPGFVLFFFAAGAMLTALVAWLVPTTSIAMQLGLFIVASLGTLLSLRGVIQQRFFAAAPSTEGEDVDRQMAVPGDRGVVCNTIVPPAEGRIKYSGSSWRATADERIEEGEIIAVVRQKGLVIHVEKV